MTILQTATSQRESTLVYGEFKLSRGETRRLPNSVRWIKVSQGCAWVVVGQEDVILIPGDTLDLVTLPRQAKILTAMGRAPLVLQVK